MRGVNVGGRNILPMKELARELEKSGYANVKTYIQSGNVVFQSSNARADNLATRIGEAILKSHGFRPNVIVLSAKQLEEAARSNPFPAAEADPKSLHLYFLASTPKDPNVGALNQLKSSTESFAVRGRCLYLHTPDGIGRSKLAGRAEKVIGVDATARNWRTVTKLMALTHEPE